MVKDFISPIQDGYYITLLTREGYMVKFDPFN